jgi:hypothetical protein
VAAAAEVLFSPVSAIDGTDGPLAVSVSSPWVRT